MSERPVLLELDGVSSIDGDRKVLERVSLVVREAETVGVVFAQAHSGKSTLLTIAAGLRAPSAGRVLFGGEPLATDGRQESKPQLGMVCRDDGGLFPNLTLLDNVALPLRYHDVSDEEAHTRALAALREVALGDAAERFPWELTRDRLRLGALARALVYRPKLVLVDDFFPGHDDSSFRLAVRTMEAAKASHGTAFLLVIEPGQEARVDRTVHIDRGHVVTESTSS